MQVCYEEYGMKVMHDLVPDCVDAYAPGAAVPYVLDTRSEPARIVQTLAEGRPSRTVRIRYT